jgi:ABC-type phosphate/phosphonate transport system substrate-binding protein
MRDTDRDRMSYLVTRRGEAVRTVPDLRNRTVAVGALDSPQATLIPLGRLRQDGLDPACDLTIRRFDVLVGMHGDHVGGELEAFRCLARGEAAACAMLDLNWDTWTRDGTIDPGQFTVMAATQRFDHCVFTVRPDLDAQRERHWLEALFAMRYDEPSHREMMDLEGLKAWLPGRTSGFDALSAAVAEERFFEQSQA